MSLPPLAHGSGISAVGDSTTCMLGELSSFNFTSRGVTDFTCWRCPRIVLPFRVMSCFVGLSTRMFTRHVEPPATVTCVPGISRPLGQDWLGSSSNNTGILLTGPTAARQETTMDCPLGITVSCFLDFTVANSFTGSDLMS